MKISIIMPSYNQGQFVDAAIQSILDQDYADWEIIFVDGGSSDDTMQRVERYRSKFAHCISEPDNGQSDALRKGFALATGQLMTWLNTDDLMLPGALKKISIAAKENPKCSWFLGNVIWIDKSDHILHCRRAENYYKALPKMGLFTAGGPSTFFSPEMYREVGGINLELHYQMDTELWWKFLSSGHKFKRLNGYIWALRLHEDAKVSGHAFQDKNSEKARRIASEKAFEKSHIQEIIDAFTFRIAKYAARPFQLMVRLVSPLYLLGRFDHLRHKGRKVEQVFR